MQEPELQGRDRPADQLSRWVPKHDASDWRLYQVRDHPPMGTARLVSHTARAALRAKGLTFCV